MEALGSMNSTKSKLYLVNQRVQKPVLLIPSPASVKSQTNVDNIQKPTRLSDSTSQNNSGEKVKQFKG